ncbi:MAG: NAD(P)/FAD-dependent oxidoreductase [Thermincola sp.]|jgi:phytoene dehydrogenase-like protein|nr:NAD(P)/FAD-dependent oxidoreductase [Thermincola sp.]MDT3702574.1 NAD(P)/FAD-dependent oxidoreductase [Thermincola sp.]
MANKYDGIIIGVGPNGLALGGYLAKAGKKVLLLDRRMEIGGGLATEQVTIPGFLHNTHAIYHMMVDQAPIFPDFELEKNYGLKFVHPDPGFVLPLKDGRSICIYQDPARTAQSIAQFSKHDAESYVEMYHKFKQIFENYLGPATYVRAHPAFETLIKFQQTDLGREIQSFAERTPKGVIDEYFENEHVKAIMLYMACKWGLDYDLEGVGYLIPLMINRATNYRLCVGGSHRLSHVMSKFIYDNGGMIVGSQVIKRIIVENGTARGVELYDGTVYEADFVASTIDPYQTFLEYVGEENLTKDFITRTNQYKWEWASLFGVHLALEFAPNFKAAEKNPDVNKGLIYLIGSETDEDLIKHWDGIKKGELGDGCFNSCFPSLHDSTQAPPGRHTALLSQMAPYRLQGDPENWYKQRNERAERIIRKLQQYAPNVDENNILWQYLSTPKDIENKFLDMKEGSYKQGGYYPLQMGYLRPNEECSRHITPIKNLYLCGASSYSGGMVVFGPGYNGANAIAEDQGFEKWWKEPPNVTRARELNLL